MLEFPLLLVDSPALQEDLCDQILKARVEGVGEEGKDLFWRAEVVKEDMPGKDVKGLDQLDRETHKHIVMETKMLYLDFPLISNRKDMNDVLFCFSFVCVRVTCAACAAGMPSAAAVLSARRRLGPW